VVPVSGEKAQQPFWSGRPVIDCDLHNEVPSLEVLKPYLADHWCAYIEESAFRGPDADDYPKGAPTSIRPGLEWEGEVEGGGWRGGVGVVRGVRMLAGGYLSCNGDRHLEAPLDAAPLPVLPAADAARKDLPHGLQLGAELDIAVYCAVCPQRARRSTCNRSNVTGWTRLPGREA